MVTYFRQHSSRKSAFWEASVEAARQYTTFASMPLTACAVPNRIRGFRTAAMPYLSIA